MAPTFSLLTAALLVAQNPAVTAPAAPASTCPCQKNNNVTQVQYVQPVPADVAATSGSTTVSNDNHPILNRIRGWFRKDTPVETSMPVNTSEPPVDQKRGWLRMPTTSPTPTSAPSYVTPTGSPFPVQSQAIQTIPTSPAAPLAPVAPTALPAAPIKIVTPVSATAPANQPAVQVHNGMIATPSAPVSQPVLAANVTSQSSRPNKISRELVDKVGHDEHFTWITGQVRIENGVHVLHYATPETQDQYNGHVVLTSNADIRNLQDGAYVCVRGSVAPQANGQTLYRVQGLDVMSPR